MDKMIEAVANVWEQKSHENSRNSHEREKFQEEQQETY
jgi:hypothetical protein